MPVTNVIRNMPWGASVAPIINEMTEGIRHAIATVSPNNTEKTANKAYEL